MDENQLPSTPSQNDILNDNIILEIQDELDYQQQKSFDGNTEEFDKKNTPNDWVAYITGYAGKATDMNRNCLNREDFRKNMIKVAALAISGIRAHDKGYFEEDIETPQPEGEPITEE